MKKLCFISFAFLLCFIFFGCESIIPDTDENSSLKTNEAGTVIHYEEEYIHGDVIEIISENTLVVKVYYSYLDEHKWGDTVYVITEEADQWCVGDQVEVRFSEIQYPYDTAEYVKIKADQVSQALTGGKPIIYLYPEAPTVCTVKATLNGEFTCTYPVHGSDGWQNFTTYPDGTIVFPDGKEYYALYWEGILHTQWDFSKGFCIAGKDTAAFLEWALAAQGLSRREANEFIVYWLPHMEVNPYNVISFQSSAYTDCAALEITPTPDNLIRVFMAYYPTDTVMDIEPQAFEPIARKGFTVVEWGGDRVKKP